jgi:hypothetical protein
MALPRYPPSNPPVVLSIYREIHGKNQSILSVWGLSVGTFVCVVG